MIENLGRITPPVATNKPLPQQHSDIVGEPDNVSNSTDAADDIIRNENIRREKKFKEVNRFLQNYATRLNNGEVGLDQASAAKAAASRKALAENLPDIARKAFQQSAGENGEHYDKQKARAAVDAAIRQASVPFLHDAMATVDASIKAVEEESQNVMFTNLQLETEKALQDLQTEVIPQTSELADLGQKIIDAITGIKDGYMEVFLQATEKLNAFFKAFEAIRATLHTHLGGPDNGKQPFHFEDLCKKFRKLLEDYNTKDAQLFPLPDKEGNYATTTKEIAENWIAQLGLPEACLVEDPVGSGNYRVKMDFSPITSIIESLDGFELDKYGPIYWVDPARYGAWESGFNAQVARLQSSIEILMQKSNNANSGFNRTHEILKKYFDDMLSLAIQILKAA